MTTRFNLPPTTGEASCRFPSGPAPLISVEATLILDMELGGIIPLYLVEEPLVSIEVVASWGANMVPLVRIQHRILDRLLGEHRHKFMEAGCHPMLAPGNNLLERPA